MAVNHKNQSTKERILAAAGELFAVQGFDGTTIRDICAKADVNLASVNYHFNDKENLFGEVIRFGFESAMSKYPPNYRFEEADTPEKKLRQFIWNILMRRYDRELPSWFSVLISRHMPTAHEHVIPFFRKMKSESLQTLRNILKELIADNPDEQQLRFAESGIMGHILFHTRPAGKGDSFRIEDISSQAEFEEFVDRVYEFSIGGLSKLLKKEI